MASVRGILNIQSLNELTYENRTPRQSCTDRTRAIDNLGRESQSGPSEDVLRRQERTALWS